MLWTHDFFLEIICVILKAQELLYLWHLSLRPFIKHFSKFRMINLLSGCLWRENTQAQFLHRGCCLITSKLRQIKLVIAYFCTSKIAVVSCMGQLFVAGHLEWRRWFSISFRFCTIFGEFTVVCNHMLINFGCLFKEYFFSLLSLLVDQFLSLAVIVCISF